MYRPKNKVQTVLTALMSIVFLSAGLMKLTGADMAKASFEAWGYPVFFMYVVGLCEVAGAVGLWRRRFSYAAKVCFIILMAGAVLTHLVFDGVGEAIVALVLLIFAAVTLTLHRKERDTNDDLMPAA